MGETICGHEREALIFACKYHATHEQQGLEFPLDAVREMSGEVPSPGNTYGPASVAVADAVKLDAIIAELMRALAWFAYDEDPGDALRIPAMVITSDGSLIHVELFPTWESCGDPPHGRELTMAQARAFALRLLEGPTLTTQDVERMIEEVTS
jgi:hypothetical protein